MNEGVQGEAARPTVFLSYARADRERATRLAAALESQGFDVWWDALIEGGAAFARTIESALDDADAVVVAWSGAAIASDWVLDEASRGRDERKLVPVSLDGTEPPLGFRQYQSVDLSQWQGDPAGREIAGVARAIRTAIGPHAHAPRTGLQPRVGSATTSRRGILVAAAGAALAGAAGFAAWRAGYFGRGAAAGNSVAVLPFVNMSGDPGQDYFSDGLSEELRATLARNINLRVMAQASSARFRDRKDDVPTIAAKLGVAFLLDGTVRRSGDVLRITADLIEGTTGFSRWSQTFDRVMQDVFAIQTEIAGTVANALVARVADGGAAPMLAPGSTKDVAAYDAYLRGRALYDLSADEESERAALGQFDAAIAADPGYAAAHAARARSLTAIANQYGAVSELDALYGAAIVSAKRAIELAPDFAEAYSTLGFTLFQGRLDARAARAPFERSRELGPGEATVMARYAQYSARIGRDAVAASSIGRALQLDPLNPLIHRAAGSIAYAARDYAGSIPHARRALAMNARMSRAHAAIGDALLALGRLADARAEYGLEPVEDFRLTGEAIVGRRLGDHAGARAAHAKLVEDLGDRVLYQQAQIHAQWGDLDAAIAKLEQARRIGDSGLIYLRNDPLLDPLRTSPRFAGLLESIGFD